MAIPNTYTFKLSDVAAELQITGSTGLNELMTGARGAPKVSYDDTYEGTRTCLRNFRNFDLMSTICDLVAQPIGLAYDNNGSMWVPHYTAASITKITSGGTKTNYTGLGAGARGIAFDGTNMWTVNRNNASVSKVTPAGVISTYTGVGSTPMTIGFDGTNMWSAGSCIAKITPAGAITTWVHSNASVNGGGFAYASPNMWLVDHCNSGGVYKISSTGSKTYYGYTYTSGSGARAPQEIVFDGTSLWTINNGDNGVTKINPSTGVRTFYEQILPPDSGANGLTFDGTYLWGTDYTLDNVYKISTSGTLVTTYSLLPEERTRAIAFDGAKVWAVNYDCCSVTLIGAI